MGKGEDLRDPPLILMSVLDSSLWKLWLNDSEVQKEENGNSSVGCNL